MSIEKLLLYADRLGLETSIEVGRKEVAAHDLVTLDSGVPIS